jgi:cell division protein FtsW (lipid II flippase)
LRRSRNRNYGSGRRSGRVYILVVTVSIPNTGIALPFFSYGGTALVMLLFEMGVVLGISRKANQRKVIEE